VEETQQLIGNMLNKNQNQGSGKNSSNIQSGRDTVININVENVYINFGNKKKFVKKYKKIYDWHTTKGKVLFQKRFPNAKESHPYLKIVNNLKVPKEASFDDLKTVAESVNAGAMSWSMMTEINGVMIGEIAQNMLDHIDHLKEKAFAKEVEEIIKEKVPEIKALEDNESNKKNVGGFVYLKQTLAEYSNDSLTTPEYLGLEIVKDEGALVNLALNDKIKIIEVRLEKGESATDHFVVLRIKNKTYSPLKFRIPKGQVFENKDFENGGQNLVSSDEHNEIILIPFVERELKIDAYCVNESKGYPGGEGNVAIFKLKDTDFKTGKQLWEQRREYLGLFGKLKYVDE